MQLWAAGQKLDIGKSGMIILPIIPAPLEVEARRFTA
jgi:hypothetical protein